MQFKVFLRNSCYVVAHSNWFHCRDVPCGFSGNRYSVEIDDLLQKVQDYQQDDELATSRHLIRSLLSATGQTKIVLQHHSHTEFHTHHRHDLRNVFDLDISLSTGKTSFQTWSWGIVHFGNMPPECLLRVETIDGSIFSEKNAISNE